MFSCFYWNRVLCLEYFMLVKKTSMQKIHSRSDIAWPARAIFRDALRSFVAKCLTQRDALQKLLTHVLQSVFSRIFGLSWNTRENKRESRVCVFDCQKANSLFLKKIFGNKIYITRQIWNRESFQNIFSRRQKKKKKNPNPRVILKWKRFDLRNTRYIGFPFIASYVNNKEASRTTSPFLERERRAPCVTGVEEERETPHERRPARGVAQSSRRPLSRTITVF